MPTMILRPKASPRHQGPMFSASAAAPAVALPGWLRRAVPDVQGPGSQGIEDIAIAAGAAIGALDAVVRRQERWGGAWRQRLALAAAAATARQAGRVEDETQLRDAVLLTRPGDDAGPGGRMLLAWCRLAAQSAGGVLTEASIAKVLEDLGHARDDEAARDLAADLRQLGAGVETVRMLTGAFIAAERYGFGHAVGAWLADALLAERLGWAYAVPLLGTGIGLSSSRSRRPAAAFPVTGLDTDADRAKNLLAAVARAALRAIDLSAELGRRADRLLAIAPKLRAKGADAVVDRLLDKDALVASRGDETTGMSDRGLRRLFDRLVSLGAVRELSGRATFRVYGL